MGYAEDESAGRARLYRSHGMVPSWERVWRNGRDVTAEAPSGWPPPWSWYVAGRRGPQERDFWLGQHAAAVAEQSVDEAPE